MPQRTSLKVWTEAAAFFGLNGKGLAVTIALAIAAQFISEHYNAPAMLMALLIGIAFHFLAEDGQCVAGINFASKTVLRIGVAVLGARIRNDRQPQPINAHFPVQLESWVEASAANFPFYVSSDLVTTTIDDDRHISSGPLAMAIHIQRHDQHI